MTPDMLELLDQFRENALAEGIPADDISRWTAAARLCAFLDWRGEGPVVGRLVPPALSGIAGGCDQHGQEEAERVDADVTFAARDLLARVDALAGRGHIGRGLDALGVENAGAGLGITAFSLPDQVPQKTVELVKTSSFC